MKLSEVPGSIIIRFEQGYVPMDSPPGLEEYAYRAWKEAGGTVKAPPPPGARAMPIERTMYAVVAECNDVSEYHALFKFEKDAEEEAERLNGQENATYQVVAVWCTERFQEAE